jgi:hypothetical protein
LGKRTFDNDVIDLPVIVVALSLGVEISVGTFGNCKDSAVGGEGFDLL